MEQMTTTLRPAPEAVPPVAPPDASAEADILLMRKAAQGDRDAYAQLFETHAETIRRLAYLIVHDRDRAEYIMQETFLRELAKIDSYRAEAPPRSWFSSIAIKLCRHHLRDGRKADFAQDSTLENGHRLRRERHQGVVSTAAQ